MKFTILLLAVCMALTLVSAIDENKTKHLNRPKFDIYGPRQRRSPDGEGAKGGVKVHPLFDFRPTTKPMPDLRKGEYVCGDKICKLKRGVVPEGCDGICQYPV